MPEYRRPIADGGTWFITLVTHERRPILVENRGALRASIAECRERRPFGLDAIVLLPDHVHLMMTLDDDGLSDRIARIKGGFTLRVGPGPPSGAEPAASGGGPGPTLQSRSRTRQRYQPIWQKRFHDHLIRDDNDYERHLDYLVYNPAHHGHATCPHAWPHSSFHALVETGRYDADWSCTCHGHPVQPPPRPRHL